MRLSLCLPLVVVLAALTSVPAADTPHWPMWRGPEGDGVARDAAPPVEWSETKNIKWKIAVPGAGMSTPIVWGDQIFLMSAVGTGKKVERKEESSDGESNDPEAGRQEEEERGRRGRRFRFGRGRRSAPDEIHSFVLMSVDLKTGKTKWKSVATEALPHEGHHGDNTFASGSPVTDGEVVVGLFGSRGLYCYDLAGEKKWAVDLGDMRTRNGFGEGASPALHGDSVIVNWDQEGESFIVALDKKSGDERWRRPRDEKTSWTTPVVVETKNGKEVIVNGRTSSVGYDLATGKTLWTCRGQTENVIPTPVIGHGMVFLTSGFRGSRLQAVKLGGKGDLTDSKSIAWELDRGTPYVPSPLLYDDLIYFFQGNRNRLSVHDAKTGKPHIQLRAIDALAGVYASPVGENGKVYLLGRAGKCVVIEKSTSYEEVATNELDDRFDASPAIVGNVLLLRGHKSLYCIEEK